MALTPEDVVNKRFQPTKFREGYDQDEVDDFLDDVVKELRRLIDENEELRQRLAASETRATEAENARPVAPPAPVVEAPAPAPEPVVVPSVPEPAPAAVVAAPTYAEPASDETAGTNNLLQLARRLHEEHVREGIEKRDALIAEGHRTAARVVAEAEVSQRAQVEQFEVQHRARVEAFEADQRSQLQRLENERLGLEHRINELRSFEREYRQKLKSYIEGQLHDLEGKAPESFSAPSSAPASFQGFGSN